MNKKRYIATAITLLACSSIFCSQKEKSELYKQNIKHLKNRGWKSQQHKLVDEKTGKKFYYTKYQNGNKIRFKKNGNFIDEKKLDKKYYFFSSNGCFAGPKGKRRSCPKILQKSKKRK